VHIHGDGWGVHFDQNAVTTHIVARIAELADAPTTSANAGVHP